jgi:hypothetical protein
MLARMNGRQVVRRLPVAGAAVAGAVVGHALAYALAVPEPAHGLALLLVNGHAYWSAAVAAAMVLGLGSLLATLARHFRAGLRRGHPRAGEPFARLAARLAFLQVTIYLVQELLERVVAGIPLGGPVDARLLLTGVLVQLLVATTLAAGLAWAGRVAEVAGRALARRHPLRPAPRPGLRLPRPAGWVRPAVLLAAGLGGRAPPAGGAPAGIGAARSAR